MYQICDTNLQYDTHAELSHICHGN